MYVYLKFGIDPPVVKVISNVTIDDNCGPVVDGQLIRDTPGKENESKDPTTSSVDAISWFKSLPMQAVYIDCSTRDARWCPKRVSVKIVSLSAESQSGTTGEDSVCLRRKPTRRLEYVNPVTVEQSFSEGGPFMPESARPLFSEHPGIADFNPQVDEMFERVESLCSHWNQLSEKGQINKEIAKILHCYVFPAVTFQKEDMPLLQETLRLIKVKQEAIEREIMNLEQSISLTEKFLARQKEVLFANEAITSEAYLQACDPKFVDRLYVDVTRDIQDKNMKLDILQVRVNDLKKKGESAQKLSQERDDVHDSLQKLIAVREAICNFRYRPFASKSKRRKNRNSTVSDNETSLHGSFEKAHQQMLELKDRLMGLCYRKLHAVSVREAVESTMKTLRQEHPRSKGDFAEFSIYGNSENSHKKAWKSMQTSVDEWMSTNNSLSQLHLAGCQLIKDLAEGMLNDSQIASWSVGMDSMDVEVELKNFAEGDQHTDCDILSGSPFNAVLNVPVAPALGETEDVSSQRAPMVQVIRDQALQHSWDMAEKIVSRMKFDTAPDIRHVNRAWMCYGPYFWKEVGEAIERVYTHFQAPRAQQIYSQVASAALADIMDSNFFQQLCGSGRMQDEETVSVASLQSLDTISTLSLDLQRFSVSDLYTMANRDGAKLSVQMELGHPSSPGRLSEELVDKLTQPDNTHKEDGTAITDADKFRRDTGSTSSSDNTASCHSDDFDSLVAGAQHNRTETISSTQTVASVLGLFDAIVKPYHEKVQEVIKAPDIMEKMRAVWQSVDFLSKKTGEVCNARGMDNLLPMSIFATASCTEELFVKYFIQLLILLDFKPSFALHCVFDFSLTNAFSTYMFLFEAKLPSPSRDSSDSDNHDL